MGKKFVKEGIELHNTPWEKLFKSLNESSIDLILTSPPYNIGSKSPRKDGFRKLGKFDPKSFGAIRGYEDNLPEDVYQKGQKNFLIACANLIKDNGVIAYNHKNRRKNGELIPPHRWFPLDILILHEEIVLNRNSSHNNEPSILQPTTERLFIFKKHKKSKIYFDKSKNDEFNYIKDLWPFPIIKDPSANRHCAPFHLKFARQVIFRYCRPDGLVCDPYSGSGTTMLASHNEGRRFVGSEKLEKYFNLSVNRFNSLTEKEEED